MVESKQEGAIVNLSSVASTMALHHHLTYCASKGAVDQITRVMALELGPHKVKRIYLHIFVCNFYPSVFGYKGYCHSHDGWAGGEAG